MRDLQTLAILRTRNIRIHSVGLQAEALQLSTRIVDYLTEHGGQASSSNVVQHFGNDVGPSQAALFRQLLQQVRSLTPG